MKFAQGITEVKNAIYMKIPVPSIKNKRVLITGAGSGIGRATAVAVAARGAQLVLTDISAENLLETVKALGKSVIYHQSGDVSNFDWVSEFGRQVHAEIGTLDVIMNIAGVSAWGPVEKLAHSTWKKMVDVNLMGPIHIIETFVPPMVFRGEGGHLVNVSSAAGLLALPWHAAYSASKFGLRGVSDVLRMDLREKGIGVSLVCPGGVDTPLVHTVDIAGIDRENPKVQEAVGQFQKIAVTPEKVAQVIIAGIMKNRYLVYSSADVRFGYFMLRKFAFPYEIAMRLANRRFTALEKFGGVTSG